MHSSDQTVVGMNNRLAKRAAQLEGPKAVSDERARHNARLQIAEPVEMRVTALAPTALIPDDRTGTKPIGVYDVRTQPGWPQ